MFVGHYRLEKTCRVCTGRQMYVTNTWITRTEDEDTLTHGSNLNVKVQKANFGLIIHWLSADTGTV